jgi:TRAP-type C4-dicarboxylate transport system permease small subunit
MCNEQQRISFGGEDVKRVLSVIAVAVMLAAIIALPVYGTNGDDEVIDVVRTGIDRVKHEVFMIFGVCLPIGLGLFAIFYGVRKGIAVLRGIVGVDRGEYERWLSKKDL